MSTAQYRRAIVVVSSWHGMGLHACMYEEERAAGPEDDGFYEGSACPSPCLLTPAPAPVAASAAT